MRNTITVFILFLLLPMGGLAQSGKLFSADSELSNSLIYNMAQDKHGIVWIATEDGLNSYDGSKFTIHKQDKNDPASLGNNFTRVLFEDSRGNNYIGLFHGLQLYDYATDTFTDIPMYLSNGEEVKPHITSIIERKNGDLLIGTTGQGIYTLAANEKPLCAKQVNGIAPSIYITTLYEDKHQNIWVSTEDKGLYQLKEENKLISYFRNNDLVLNNISSICEDKEGNLLIGSLSNGLFRYDEEQDIFQPIPYKGEQNLSIKIFYVDNEDILIGTDGQGLKVYKSQEGKIVESDLDVTIVDFDNSKIHSILKDSYGNIWLGIYRKGVLLIPAQTNKFNYIGHKSIKNNIIGNSNITAISRDHDGTFWVGTDNDGLYHITLDGRQLNHFPYTGRENSVPASIMYLLEDSNGELWIGSYLHGVGKVNKKTGTCQYLRDFVDENGSPIQRIYCLEEDENKRLWIGTIGAGLYSLDLRTNQITNHNRPAATDQAGDENYLINYWVSTLLFSEDKLYIGTFNGLACLDLKTNNYTSTFGGHRLLSEIAIYDLHDDQQGTIWIGTSEGLFSYDKVMGTIREYGTHEGLPNNVICAIQEDRDKNLWLSTHYGLSQFSLNHKTFINYYANDGLQGNEFSKRAAINDYQGQLFFCGINGITYFNPRDIVYERKKMQIRITDFYINDKAVKKGTQSGKHTVIDTSVIDAHQFNLSYRDNSFSLEFSVMEFHNPERISYMYSVNGEKWVSLHPRNNRVTFSNMSPGKYHFKILAKDHQSYSDEKEITVVISPPWYQTLWARVVYLFIGLFIIFLFILYIRQRYRSRQNILEHQHAEELNEAKLQFFINIAHEIRTPMSLVISPLKKLILTDHDSERQKSYHTIQRNAVRILNLINQLMDIRKIDKGLMSMKFQEVEIIAFIHDLYTYFEYPAKAKNVRFHIETELKELPVWVDPKNFDKIIMNVLSNAFKYTPDGGEIIINIQTIEADRELDGCDNYLEIAISDTGVGIKDENKERVFDRFYQISENQNNANMSAGVGLHLTRSLVELHYGYIWVEDHAPMGSRFIIRIPLGNKHLRPEEMATHADIRPDKPYFFETATAASFVEEGVKAKPKTRRRVMVVDDDDEIRHYICQELGDDYQMEEYPNGKEALNAILKKAPDLIISDVMMPEMDGITLCRKVKQNININHVPVILLTARSNEEDNLEGLTIGADAFIPKPFNIDILRSTVENIIRNRDILRNTFKGNQQQEDKVRKITIKSADEKLMEKVMKVVNDNMSNPDLSVEMIADRVGISRVHLHRKLKEITNQTTRDLIRNIRLKQAADLLVNKNLSVSEVSEATGFTNLSYFSNAFKELYGMSPSAYVEQHKGS
ncbi:response regulator [Parabacteroides sp. OttesenSCG-928-B22]|nr:response regulator [Parabacteroides sp. OttesenSCG-928-B22]